MSLPKVLAVTRRPADLCATGQLLLAAGFELLTVDGISAARAFSQTAPLRGIFLCNHSWSDAERELLTSDLKTLHLPLMNCPGCVGCDEQAALPGTLDLLLPLTSLIERLDRPTGNH